MSNHESNSSKQNEKQRKVLQGSLDRQKQALNESGVTVTHKGQSRTRTFQATFRNPRRRKTKTFPLTAQNGKVEPLEISENGQ